MFMKSKRLNNQILTFMKQKFFTGLIFLVVILSSCGKLDNKSVLSEYYDVIDSTYSTEDNFIWFDNEKIIFSGGKFYADGTTEKGIYIWNIKENKVQKYAEQGRLNCYFNDHVFYFSHVEYDDEGRRINFFKSGKFGEEKSYGVTIYKRGEKLFRKKPFKWVRNNFSCKKNDVPKGMENHVWVALLEEHGYLNFGVHGNSMHSNDSVFLHKTNGSVIEFPFKRKDVYPLEGQYVPYEDAYFYWAHLMSTKQRELWESINCSKGWWIYPETGEARSECIPYTPWKKSHIIIPTVKGLFMVSNNYTGNDPRESGGYFYINKNFKKVIKGRVRRVKVSPDGCKIALTHQLGNHTNLKVKLTLKVINVCNEKE